MDFKTNKEVQKVIIFLVQEIGQKLHFANKRAGGVSIHIRDNKLQTKQWQCKLERSTQEASKIADTAFELFVKNYKWQNDIRTITVTAIDLIDAGNSPTQLDLFTNTAAMEKAEKLDKTIFDLKEKYGENIIKPLAIADKVKNC